MENDVALLFHISYYYPTKVKTLRQAVYIPFLGEHCDYK